MSYSDVEIVNIALGLLGKSSIRNFSITDTDPVTGRLAEKNYLFLRDSLLAGHDWSFARASAFLNRRIEEHPEGVLFALPSDCLVPRRISPRAGRPNTWKVEGTSVVIPFDRISVCGARPVLRYTKAISITSLFKPYFIHALSLAIAKALCMPLTADMEMTSALGKEAVYYLAQAKLIDANIGDGDDFVQMDIDNDTFIRPDAGAQDFNG